MNLPIITLEVQGMKQTIKLALSQQAALMDRDLQAAVDAYCSEGNVALVVREEVNRAMKEAIKEEVYAFFRYGSTGRRAIHEAVQEHLNEMYPIDDDSN